MNTKERMILIQKFNSFLNEYSEFYSPDIIDIIKTYFWKNQDSLTTLDVLMQVYQELGIYEGRKSYYNYHLNNINKLFNINCNVVEIGAGHIPSFANMLAREQLKNKKGTVTIYDPCLIKLSTKYKNMKLHKENFNYCMDVSNYDLMLGLLPCEATEEIIKSAIINNKDFYISMCGCNHSKNAFLRMFGFCMPHDMYQTQMIELANDLMDEYNHNKEVVTCYMPDEYNVPYPVIYSKYK